MASDKLNEINTPKPNSFDNCVLNNNSLNINIENVNSDFAEIYGDGQSLSKGIPLFVFNYLDWKLWLAYFNTFRDIDGQINSSQRDIFFKNLGCGVFGLEVFNNFYFSTTRRSLEHFFSQANVGGENPSDENINCLGNYAMIGGEINSSGSNWSPKTKLDHYLDSSGKVRQVSVASLKFRIMMQKCKDNCQHRKDGQEWNFEDIKSHQENMLKVLFSERQP
jgi:hypothetical protein